MRLLIHTIHPAGYPVQLEIDPYDSEKVTVQLERLLPRVKTLLDHLTSQGYRAPTRLHALVEAFEERAAIAEYCAGLSREDAERLAWQELGGEPTPSH